MKLTDEMYEIGVNSNKICTIYNEDYVILSKKMPVMDSKLQKYIADIRELRNKGVNIAAVTDYKLIPGTTTSFNKNTLSYTKGVFLEERAKGTNLDVKSIWLHLDKEYDFKEVAECYLRYILEYVLEIESRASADQAVYDKLIADCVAMYDRGLEIDPKPTNFYFDRKNGYTIIDVITTDRRLDESFPIYISSIVFGYGRPRLSIGSKYCDILPKEYEERLQRAVNVLCDKISAALKRYKFKEESISKIYNRETRDLQVENVEFGELEDYIARTYEETKREENLKQNIVEDPLSLNW